MTQIKEQNKETASPLVITRFFDAPVELIWKAWTESSHLMKWWSPRDFTTPSIKLDFRIGGKYLFCMRTPEGKDIWTTGVYKEIIINEKIVFTDSFADESGNIVPPEHYGFIEHFPSELVVTVIFEMAGDKTKMTLTHDGFPKKHGEMAAEGWKQMFDKLAESLK